MTYGLRNASQTFQRQIFRALGDLDFIFAFIDEKTFANSNAKIKRISLTSQHRKMRIRQSRVEFLGHTINSEGCKPTPDKVRAIRDFPKPLTIAELRRFLGLINFYHRNLRNAASIQAPLNEYLRDSRKNDKRQIAWTQTAKEAFAKCKESLINAVMLSHPSIEAETRLISDASDFAMGAVLEQRLDNSWKPLAFFSRKLSSSQLKYNAYDRELTAVFEAVKYFRYFLEGRDFKILTDHLSPLFTRICNAQIKPRRVNKDNYRSSHSLLHVSSIFQAATTSLPILSLESDLFDFQ